MDEVEARKVLNSQLSKYRSQSYTDLQRLLTEEDSSEVTAISGVKYQIKFQAHWDDKESGDLRVMGAIDDFGVRAYFPLVEDFIVDSNGNFIDE